ncbi:hypothetical protein AMECASPLE_013036 [Ameca splendens]|uniref:Uncharacterized protein n=1 Tax=Ameca splendens TaxID=208324 RepID=A0ABV0Y1M1_9TELE
MAHSVTAKLSSCITSPDHQPSTTNLDILVLICCVRLSPHMQVSVIAKHLYFALFDLFQGSFASLIYSFANLSYAAKVFLENKHFLGKPEVTSFQFLIVLQHEHANQDLPSLRWSWWSLTVNLYRQPSKPFFPSPNVYKSLQFKQEKNITILYEYQTNAL